MRGTTWTGEPIRLACVSQVELCVLRYLHTRQTLLACSDMLTTNHFVLPVYAGDHVPMIAATVIFESLRRTWSALLDVCKAIVLECLQERWFRGAGTCIHPTRDTRSERICLPFSVNEPDG